MPRGWRQFYALRNVNAANEVITFGSFEAPSAELRVSPRPARTSAAAPPYRIPAPAAS